MARAFRVDLPRLVALRYPDREIYLAELIRYSLARGAHYVRITPADQNKGYFRLIDDGEEHAPASRLPGEDGLATGFLVSDTITQISADGTRWIGRISGTYDTASVTDAPGHHTITLRRRRGDTLLNTEKVLELARTYAELCPIPVEIETPDGEIVVVNRQAPWQVEGGPNNDQLDVVEYGAEFLGADPLDSVPLTTLDGELFGVAYILPQPPGPREVPRHRLYREGLLTLDPGTELLPEWAFFARCALDVGRLPADPAAARDDLGQALRTWLLQLATRQPQRLARFVATHHLSLKIHAVHDRELAGIITRWLPFETSIGRLTITELLGRTRHLRYASTRDAFRQLAPMAGRNAPFVNAGHLYDGQLLERLPELYEGVTVERWDAAGVLADLDDPPLSDRSAQLRLLEVATKALSETGCVAVMKSFEPANIHALYVDNPDKLCLNYRSPIIQHLARLADETVLSRTVQLLYAQARLQSHSPLRGTDSNLLSQALLDLVGLAALEEDLNGLDHA